MQDLLIEGLNLSSLSVVFLHFFLDEAFFGSKLTTEPCNFFISLLLHLRKLLFVVSFLDLDLMVLVANSLSLLGNLLLLGSKIQLHHIALFLDLMQTGRVRLELFLLFGEFFLDSSFFSGDLFDLLVLEPGSCLDVIELIHGLGGLISRAVQLSLLFFELARQLVNSLLILTFDLRDLLGFLAFFELLGISSHFFLYLLHDSFILLILL